MRYIEELERLTEEGKKAKLVKKAKADRQRRIDKYKAYLEVKTLINRFAKEGHDDVSISSNMHDTYKGRYSDHYCSDYVFKKLRKDGLNVEGQYSRSYGIEIRYSMRLRWGKALERHLDELKQRKFKEQQMPRKRTSWLTCLFS